MIYDSNNKEIICHIGKSLRGRVPTESPNGEPQRRAPPRPSPGGGWAKLPFAYGRRRVQALPRAPPRPSPKGGWAKLPFAYGRRWELELFHQRTSTGVSVPRETGAPNFVRLSSAKICTMCEEPKGVEGVLARAKKCLTSLPPEGRLFPLPSSLIP